MTDKTINNEREDLYSLIKRYFEGETSSADESRLKSLLSRSEDRSEEVEEARAVLGVFATSRVLMKRTATTGRKRIHRFFAPLGAVASVAALLVMSIGVATNTRASDLNKCYVSIGGHVINDRNTVEALVIADIASIAEASQSVDKSVTDGLNLLGESLEQSNIQ